MQASDPVLDPDVIASLKELGGEDEPELFVELVDLFLEDARAHLGFLSEALERGDALAIERTAHTLKSSCGNIGAKRLSRSCADLEQLGKHSRLEEAAELVRLAIGQYEEVRSALGAERA